MFFVVRVVSILSRCRRIYVIRQTNSDFTLFSSLELGLTQEIHVV